MKERFGDFLVNGELANKFRFEEVVPWITSGNDIVFDMAGVSMITSSFGNALIANLVHYNEEDFFAHVRFSNCDETCRGLIKIAVNFGLSLQKSPIEAV